MPELHPSEERLTDLALSDLDSRDQDALTAHLATCEACRRRYTAIADSVDGMLAAAPSMAPPPGFTVAVLAALGLDPTANAGSQQARSVPSDATGQGWPGTRAPAAEPSRWRGYLLAAAAAVLALVVGAGGAALMLRTSAPPPSASLAGEPFVTTGGDVVGTVQVARYEGEGVLVMSVEGRPGATYDCRVILADGTQQTLATWTLPADGSAVWVVDLPGGGVTRMELVAPSGRVWASAEL